jgi:hypothetical protein
VGEIALGRGPITEEGAALHVTGNVYAGQAQEGGREVHETDEAVGGSSGGGGREVFPTIGEADDQGHAGSAVVGEALSAGHRAPVIGEMEDEGVFHEAVRSQLVEDRPNLGVHGLEAVVVAREIEADCREVREVGGQNNLGGFGIEPAFLPPLGEQIALVGIADVEHREERAVRRLPAPMRVPARFIPCVGHGLLGVGRAAIVIGLAVVRGEIAGVAQVFGEEGRAGREGCQRTHVLPADAGGVHA